MEFYLPPIYQFIYASQNVVFLHGRPKKTTVDVVAKNNKTFMGM